MYYFLAFQGNIPLKESLNNNNRSSAFPITTSLVNNAPVQKVTQILDVNAIMQLVKSGILEKPKKPVSKPVLDEANFDEPKSLKT